MEIAERLMNCICKYADARVPWPEFAKYRWDDSFDLVRAQDLFYTGTWTGLIHPKQARNRFPRSRKGSI